MPKLMRAAVELPWMSGLRGGDRNVALRRKLMLCVTGAMLGAFLQGCSANKQPSQGETSLANAAKDVAIPLAAGKMKNPLPETDEVVSQGQEVFLGACAQCHGAEAHGDTTVGRSMAPPAMDLSSPHVQHWNDAELFWIIQNGVSHTGMPAWKSSISDDDTWKLARYIHNLSRAGAASASTVASSQTQAASSTQDKYTLKIPNGLAFSEFKGYEGWSVISLSHNGDKLAAILGNPVMIDAYQAGIPGNGKPFRMAPRWRRSIGTRKWMPVNPVRRRCQAPSMTLTSC